MPYDPSYYLEHRDKMIQQMRSWRENNPEYHKNYYQNIIKKKLMKKRTDKFILNEETIKQISPIKIGKSPYGLNGKKRRQLLELQKNNIRAEKFKASLYQQELIV